MRRSRFALVAGLGGLVGVVAFSVAVASGGQVNGQASTPPYGSDLAHKAYAISLASDEIKPSAVSGFTIHFLDVGQGDAILITVNGERLLLDGGPSRERLRTRLQSLGITDIDAIAVSNPDADHIRGLIEALALFPVERSYASASTHTTQTYADLQAAIANETGIQVITFGRGATVALGGLLLNVLHPTALSGDRNEDSLALRLTCGSVSVLLMGDATTTSEQSMLSAGLIGNVDVLKAGHHGSNTSTSQAFLDVARPEHAVISAGLNNQYGHPHAEVVSRLQGIGAQLVYTDTTAGDDTKVMTSDCQTYSFSSVAGEATPTATVTSSPTVGTTPTATPTRTPTPTQTAASFSLPACYVAGQDKCNCSNFATHAWAQWFHENYDPGDVNKLDADNDGVVCESLP